MVTVNEVRKAQRAQGTATVLAIGTANPTNVVDQSTYPDFFFRVTNSEHKTELKEKFESICEASGIKKRHMHLTEDIIKENPNIGEHMAISMNARQDIMVEETPKLAKEAVLRAIKEWGQPMSKITHMVCSTCSGIEIPGLDYMLIKLLGLYTSVNRVMMYNTGGYGGNAVLRVAKDLAENNKGARVLVVCSELSMGSFHGPSETHLDNLLGQAVFGDGAAVAIVGADPIPGVEKPLFKLVSTIQTILPDSDRALLGQITEAGLVFHHNKDVPKIFSNYIEKSLVEAFQPLGIKDWNSIFWVAHPDSRVMLDQVETKLDLKPEKLLASRQILAEYGNMSSASVLFIMDVMRKKSAENGLKTTGEGLEWGVLMGFGAGLTLETVVLHSAAI
ncbi:hypothetical protein SLEP1_g36747 [Rubroshorea leprosula]|uniref:Chalcone synthase n=1 Tax=Rubroshorea leprosula TaxID=152421 RepID=A0AAV5KSP2_9ROSI|nr:hypothetical protein SLEP1_g36747 [Rubroshorea leprosula]